jgi:serine/threonine-protein kinase
LFVRALTDLEPLTIGPLDAPRNVFVSPDGQWIGFFAGGALKKVSITGGPPITLATVGSSAPRGAAWGIDGAIVYATSAPGTGLYRVTAGGGNAEIVTTPDATTGEAGHHWPEFLPNGNILFTILPASPSVNTDNTRIAVLDVVTGRHKVLLRGGSHAHYVPTGHLVYGVNGTLRAVPFDLAEMIIVGTPVPVMEQVLTTNGGAVDAAIATNGTLVYVRGTLRSSQRRIMRVERDGRALPISTFEPSQYDNLRLSPDGRTVAVLAANDVWLYDIVTGRRTRLTRDGAVTTPALWHPSGSHLAYTATRQGSENVWLQPSDGSSEARQLTRLDGVVDVDSWSPDGKVLAVHHHRPAGGTSMLMLRVMDGDQSAPEPFVDDEAWPEGATFSPDGRFVAYMSLEGGTYDVFIRAYPRSGGRIPVSVGGGREVVWARTGEIFYRSPTGDRMWAVPVTTQPILKVGNPRELVVGRYSIQIGGSPRPRYDISRDSRAFVMMQDVDDDAGDSTLQEIVVVQNWFDELKRLVPVN